MKIVMRVIGRNFALEIFLSNVEIRFF